MLVAWSVHSEGLGLERARLLVWDEARQLLIGRRAAHRSSHEEPLAAALASAARRAMDGDDPGRAQALRGVAVAAARLPLVARVAWSGGTATPDEAPGSPSDRGEPDMPGAARDAAGTLDSLAGPGPGTALRWMRDGRPFALLIGEWESLEAVLSYATRLDSLRRVGDAALEAEALRASARRRTREVEAIAEVARATVSPYNLGELLPLAVRVAVETCSARGGALWTAHPDGVPELQATHGPPGSAERLARALAPLAAGTIARARPRNLDRTELGELPELATEMQALAIVPLLAYGVTTGAIAVYDRLGAHPADPVHFGQTDVAFLSALADLAALAIEQARRSDELARSERRHEALRRQVSRQERLAALGEMAARVAHEVRNPLASIGAFARRAQRQLATDDPGHEYLEIVIREAERLERMAGEQLQYASLDRPRLKLESVNAVVQQALQAAGERLVRRRVRLLKRLSPDLPPLLLDAERIGRVVGNIIDHALESVAAGGRLRVESRRSGTFAVVEIAHDGLRQPGELLDQLFVPFALSRQGGPGVGLAVAQQVLKQHGGEIRVRGEGEWSSVFAFTLPIPDNEDRRRAGRDRRHARGDRRSRTPLT